MGNVIQIYDENELKEKAKAEFLSQRVSNICTVARKVRVPKETLELWRDTEGWADQRRALMSKKYNDLIERLGETPDEGAIKSYNLAVEIQQRAAAYLQAEQKISPNGLSSLLRILVDAEKVRESAVRQLGLA